MIAVGWMCEIRVCIHVMIVVGWALSIGLIDLPFSHWTHVTFKQSTHAYLGTAGRGTRKGTVGCERADGAA